MFMKINQKKKKILEIIGNERANSFWENQLSKFPEFKKPTEYSSQDDRRIFIHAKYLNKTFLPPPSPSPPSSSVCPFF